MKIADEVFKELMVMPNGEFRKVLETEGSGDIAGILEYSGALTIREKEAMEFNEGKF